MEYILAKELLDKTFKNPFNMEVYENFLVELFNTSRIHANNKINFIKKEFKEYIQNFYELGRYKDNQGGSIGLYAAELKDSKFRDRARTMQRNVVADYIENKHDAALVAFYEPNSDDWRFSFVKVSYEFGRNGPEQKLSSPKRHSFLVGLNEPNHTCEQQFLPLLQNEGEFSVDDIEEAFGIENVTDEFFQEYKKLFLDLADSLDEIKENDGVVKEEFDSKNISSSDFAKKLMGQIIFIYFLQKKGWLGVEKDKNWGTGPKNFLRKIYDKAVNEGKNFFNDVLEHLFYEGFSEDVGDYHYSKFGYKIPFLNGGLFEPINNYNWQETDVVLDNNIFGEILDTFDKFNFTIKEDEPLEKEVAVDPEMLGKVFENLLEVKDRKSKGAFYTPRHIVHYMCQENLIQYLETNSTIPETDLRKLIIEGDLVVNSIIRVNEEKKKYNGHQYTNIDLPDSIKEHSDELEDLLKKVKVVDPAVGSGAFPVGMMNEIVKARYILRLLNNIENINMYDLKRETIENSLYGVDLEQSATDVTKLRFWLSLVVDEESVENIKPLPNLDNQIRCGNSVIDGYNNIRLFDDNLILRSAQTTLAMTPTEQVFHELELKKKEFFNVSGHNIKEKLKKEINEYKWKYIETYLKDKKESLLIERNDIEKNLATKNTKKNQKKLEDKIKEIDNLNKTIEDIKQYKYSENKPFFVWELEFSEIFKGENPGFDIVIGNPPYVRQEKIKELKPYFEKYYKTYTGVADLYVYFFEKGLNILKDKGIFAFICSNKFVKANYGEKLRELILNNQLLIYNDFTGVKVFKEASVDTCVIQIKKDFVEDNEVYVDNKYYMEQKRLNSKSFIFNTPEVLNLRDKIFNQGTMIKDLDIQINRGILTGFNDAFIIDEETKNRLIKEDSKNKEIIKPLLRGKDIKKWGIHYKNLYLIHSYNGLDTKNKYPSIYKFLSQYKEKLEKRYDKGENWYNLRSCSYDDLFEKEKIIYSEISREPNFSFDSKKFYLNNTSYLLNSNEINLKYLLGLLNSNVIFWIFKYISYNLGENTYRFIKTFVEKIPIKIDIKNQNKVIKLVNEILDISNNIKLYKNLMFKLLKNNFNINKLNKNLENFYYLSEEKFLKEIKKSNKSFDEREMINKFISMKNNIKSLIKMYKIKNNELNNLIYEIYNLNKNEIEIIENDI